MGKLKLANQKKVTTAATKSDQKAIIGYEDFQKLDIRTGKIKSIDDIPDSKKLIKLQIDIGHKNF